MNEVTYKIKSETFNPEFSHVTMSKNQTYFLVGENMIGKSTFLKKITAHHRNPKYAKYEIEFDVVVTNDELKRAYRSIKLPKEILFPLIESVGDVGMKNLNIDLNSRISHEKITKLNKEIEIEINKHNNGSLERLNKKVESLKISISKISNKVRAAMVNKLEETVTVEQAIFDPQYARQVYLSDPHKGTLKERVAKKYTPDQISSDDIYYLIHSDGFQGSVLPSVRLMKILLSKEYVNASFESLKELAIKVEETEKEIRQLTYSSGFHGIPYLDDILFRVHLGMSKIEYFDDWKYNIDNDTSQGEKVMAWLHKVLENRVNNRYINGIAFDEPFNHLDNKMSTKAFKLIDKMPGTKIIATHSSRALSMAEMANVIVLWKDKSGRHCIANYSRLKRVPGVKKAVETGFSTILTESLATRMYLNKKILIVEGFRDYQILKKFLSKKIEVIPIGGTFYAKMAFSMFSAAKENVKYLFDGDSAGRSALGALEQVPRESKITRDIFGSKRVPLETLITNKEHKNKAEKIKLIDTILTSKRYDKKVKEICKKIENLFAINK